MGVSLQSDWRRSNVGRHLNNAVRKFERRVVELLVEAGYETRGSLINLTRHLDRDGTGISELARRAEMTKQAVSELAQLGEELGLVRREPDPRDGRGKIVKFTPYGLEWLAMFGRAVEQSQREMEAQLGAERVAVLVDLLQSYAASNSTIGDVDVAEPGTP